MEYHVAKTGNDQFAGTAETPFLTISKAAFLAEEGDSVVVHEGVYRECVRPRNSARVDSNRITYQAASGEKVIIKGSEQITNWVKMDDMKVRVEKEAETNIWKVELKADFFTIYGGGYNPYAEIIDGDWLMRPIDSFLHTGQVYLNGKALQEVTDKELLATGKWFTEMNGDTTAIYANFGDENPNEELAEINVRECCFWPERTGTNYITVSGFEFAHGASGWAPPTAEQKGMVWTYWSKGWIIENNILHDARCSAISLGKEISTGHNQYNRYHRKAGYQTQLETVFAAKRIGWGKETIGSHIVRNNTIYDCGQNGIVGHMGGAFSEIYGNHIYNIGNKHEFFGYEIAGIKLHAAIDTYIHHNKIHDCWMGTWLDWQAQGVRLSNNLYYDNETDAWIEVTHGPHLVDNNVFGSEKNLKNAAQGGAYIHNLFCGFIQRYDTLNRSTPYHLSHSTDIMGCAVVYGGDDRFYQNIFVGIGKEGDNAGYGTAHYDGYPTSMEEYVERVMSHGRGDVNPFLAERQPAYINRNLYLNGAQHFDREESFAQEEMCAVTISETDGVVYIDMNLPEKAMVQDTEVICTYDLPITRFTELPFEAADGSAITLDKDFFGAERGKHPMVGPFESVKGRIAIQM